MALNREQRVLLDVILSILAKTRPENRWQILSDVRKTLGGRIPSHLSISNLYIEIMVEITKARWYTDITEQEIDQVISKVSEIDNL